MKAIIPFFSFIFLFLSTSDLSFKITSSDDKVSTEILTFDGYEGGYLFFSNMERQPIVLEVTNQKILKKTDLVNGDFVGKKLKIKYKKVSEIKVDSSSEGIIEDISIIY